ncbi:DUF7115 domain-containing protein [Halobellus captivus]|uniref:DUF7115 domain-containing protein n=1 Tax=Halobellus captivus TaxID=2592614 RepID=UPI00119F7F93|nr:hypothetical protein [Halobellus captivus]
MSQPEIVQADLADEDVVARVDLGGEDELYVTPTRTLLYRAEGLLSDESVKEYPHEAERITVSEGRRKAKVTLDYGLDGEETISLPAKRFERALHPIVEGVLKANGVLEPDEPMERLFRFSELTVAIAGERVVRHIGESLWDEDFESYHFGDVTDLVFEDGSVATSIVLTVDGRQERFKAPNDEARAVRAALETTLLSYWDVDSIEEFRAAAEPEEDDTDAEAKAADSKEVTFGDGPDPLIADPSEPEEFPANATRSAEESRGDESAPGNVDALAQQVERRPEDETSGGVKADSPSQSDATESGSAPESPAATTASDAGESDPLGVSPAESGSTESTGEAGESRSTRGARDTDDSKPNPSDFAGSGFEAAAPADERVLDELAELRETVEQQSDEIRTQRELIEQLIEELRRGR